MSLSSLAVRTLLLTLSLLALPTHATDWSVVLNGRSVHIDASKDWNESNWGLGLERQFDGDARWVKIVLGNALKDSQNEMTYMAGGGIKRRFKPMAGTRDFHVDVGVIAFGMIRKDVNRSEPFPGVLPALSFGTPSVAVNVTYLPGSIGDRITNGRRIDPEIDGVLFFQLKLDAGLFSPKSRGNRSAPTAR